MPPSLTLPRSRFHSQPTMETGSDMGHVPGPGETGNGGGGGGCGDGDQKCGFCSENNFEFAFNVGSFSDRTLRLQVVEDWPSMEGNGESTPVNRSPASASRSPGSLKRRREDGQGDADGSLAHRVENIHVSSMLLAAKSPFFREKFSTEMGRVGSLEVTLRIPSSKEPAFIDLLKFMYSNVLSAKTPKALLDVFLLAYEFKVVSCMKSCSRMLQCFPLTCELALSYLSLPPNVRIIDGIKQIVDAAYDFLPDILKDITKYQDAALKLPLDRIRVMMSSDDLRFDSEDAVYDFVMKWARLHFQDLKERRDIFQSELCRLVRFPLMSYDKLMAVLYCSELDPGVAKEIVLTALFSKGKKLYQPASSLIALPDLLCRERAYKLQPVKVTELDAPAPESIVYIDLKKEECELGPITTQDFHVGSECFYLGAHRNREENQAFTLGLYLYRKKSKRMSPTLKVDCEVAVRLKNNAKYVIKKKMVTTFKDDKALGFRNLLDTSWDLFIAEDSNYFINGVFHVRAKIKIELEQHVPSQ